MRVILDFPSRLRDGLIGYHSKVRRYEGAAAWRWLWRIEERARDEMRLANRSWLK